MTLASVINDDVKNGQFGKTYSWELASEASQTHRHMLTLGSTALQ